MRRARWVSLALVAGGSLAVGSQACTAPTTAQPARREVVAIAHQGISTTAFPSGGKSPEGVAVDAAKKLLFVANWGSSVVTVFNTDDDSLVDSIPVDFGAGPTGPTAIGVNPGKHLVYVALNGLDAVGVIDETKIGDGKGDATLVTVATGAAPDAIAVDTTTDRIYVADSGEDSGGKPIVIIDGTKPTQNTIIGALSGVAGPDALAINTVTHRLYATNFTGNLYVYDLTTNKEIGAVTVGSTAHGVAVNETTNTVYVANEGDGTVTVLDGAKIDANLPATIATVKIGSADGIVANPATNDVLVAGNTGTVTTIDGSDSSILATTPVGRTGIPIALTVNPATNVGYIVNTLDGAITRFLDPGAAQDLITIPVRWCVVEGAPAAPTSYKVNASPAPAPPSPNASTDQAMLGLIADISDRVWLPGAHIALQASNALPHVPILPCPQRNRAIRPGADEQCGDFEVGNFNSSSDYDAATSACGAAWPAGSKGIIAIDMRLFDGRDQSNVLIGGVDELPSPALLPPHGSRSAALCTAPRSLLPSDVMEHHVGAIDPAMWGYLASVYGAPGDAASDFGHEFGHAMLLGHGCGFDADGDGTLPPNPGPRIFDSYCDPNPSPGDCVSGAPGSVMDPIPASQKFVSPLQREAARDAARQWPVAVTGGPDPAGEYYVPASCPTPPCGAPADVNVTKIGFAEAPDAHVSELSIVVSALATAGTDRYSVFADLDGDPSTGCAPSSAGFATGFAGAEIVAVMQVAAGVAASPTIYRCSGGALAPVVDPSIAGEAYARTLDNGDALHGVVRIRMSDAVLGPFAPSIRVQALAEQQSGGGAVGRAPPASDGGATIPLLPPLLPTCAATSPLAHPAGAIGVDATGLVPGQPADLALGTRVLGSATADAGGRAHFDVTLPSDAAPGFRLLDVVSRGTIVQAPCAIRVVAPSLTPVTRATVAPAPNGSGWDTAPVTITLAASPTTYGPPITQLVYSASGATTIAPTTVNGPAATATIAADGATTLVYSATDSSGAGETRESLVVRIDATPPAIAASAAPPPNALGWNRTSVTVSFTCSDATSGIASCPSANVLSADGANQHASGRAVDVAGNVANVTVAGIDIDETPPAIAFTGNAGSYTVAQTIQIACAATDALSGIATRSCPGASGPAYTFPLGATTLTGTATDRAGNAASASTTFTVKVTFDSLCALTGQFDTKPGVTHALCAKLSAASAAKGRGDANAEQGEMRAYRNQVAAQTGGSLTTSQAAVLQQLSLAL